MKVTIIERQEHDNYDLKFSLEKVFYPFSMKEVASIPIGNRAEKIRVELEFDGNDIPTLIKFLKNSEPCFVKK